MRYTHSPDLARAQRSGVDNGVPEGSSKQGCDSQSKFKRSRRICAGPGGHFLRDPARGTWVRFHSVGPQSHETSFGTGRQGATDDTFSALRNPWELFCTLIEPTTSVQMASALLPRMFRKARQHPSVKDLPLVWTSSIAYKVMMPTHLNLS